MLMLSARPVRKPIGGYEKDYEAPKEVFGVLLQTMGSIRQYVRDLIEIADINGDDEVRIFAEDFLEDFQDYLKQAEEWVDAASKMDANSLNIHIEDYTHFIPTE